jgi:hypothetical protein
MSDNRARLTQRISREDGVAFELLIGGEALGNVVGPPHYGPVPLWLVKDTLPHLPSEAEPEVSLTIVSVCSCGEYGCGRTACRVLPGDDEVVFCEFDIDGVSQSASYEFVFPRADFDRVVRAILEEARAVA